MLKRFDGTPAVGQLVYRPDEHGLDVEPRPEQGVASLLVNDVQIEIDEDGNLIYVWGLCSHDSWRSARLDPPTAVPGRLRYVGAEVVPGISRRLNADRHWLVSYDPSSRWLCVGDESIGGEAVEFGPDSVAVLNEAQLVALWLRPTIQAKTCASLKDKDTHLSDIP